MGVSSISREKSASSPPRENGRYWVVNEELGSHTKSIFCSALQQTSGRSATEATEATMGVAEI